MTVAPIPPPVYKIADFHAGINYRIMTPPEGTLDSIRSLDEDSLMLFYLIAGGFNEISHLIAFLGLHRSTVSKKANELQKLGLVRVGVKPGTEKKFRPTKVFVLAPDVSIDMIRMVAEEKGVDLTLGSEEYRENAAREATPQPALNLEESEQSFQPTERNQGMEGSEQFGLQRPNDLPSLGKPLNSSSNPRLPKLPGLPEYDSSWPEDMKRDWMKAYTLLLNKASQ